MDIIKAEASGRELAYDVSIGNLKTTMQACDAIPTEQFGGIPNRIYRTQLISYETTDTHCLWGNLNKGTEYVVQSVKSVI